MTDKRLESGKVENQKTTTYVGKDKDGNEIREEVKLNKDTGEVTRKVNGEEVKPEEKKENKKKDPVVLQYSPSNGEFLIIKLLQMLVHQQKEVAYYLRMLAKDKIDDEELKELLYNG